MATDDRVANNQELKPRKYRAYVMRLWPAGSGDNPPWRMVLVSSESGQRRGFSSLEELMDFLKIEMKQIEMEIHDDTGLDERDQFQETKK